MNQASTKKMYRYVDELKIPRFNGNQGENFSLWCGRVEMALRAKDLFEILKESETTSMEEQDSSKKDKAAALIVAALGDKPLQCVIADLHDPARMWRKLKTRYASSTVHSKVVMYQKIMTKKPQFAKNFTMENYIAEFESLFNQLADMGETVNETLKVAILLLSLSQKRELQSTIAALTTLSDAELSWDKATSRMIDEYAIVSPHQRTSEAFWVKEHAAVASRPRSPCQHCGKKGHPSCTLRSSAGLRTRARLQLGKIARSMSLASHHRQKRKLEHSM